jgi:hypothetical protein
MLLFKRKIVEIDFAVKILSMFVSTKEWKYKNIFTKLQNFDWLFNHLDCPLNHLDYLQKIFRVDICLNEFSTRSKWVDSCVQGDKCQKLRQRKFLASFQELQGPQLHHKPWSLIAHKSHSNRSQMAQLQRCAHRCTFFIRQSVVVEVSVFWING